MGLLSSIRGLVRQPSEASESAQSSQTARAGKTGGQPVTLQGQSLLSNRPLGGDNFSLVLPDAKTFEKFGFRLPS